MCFVCVISSCFSAERYPNQASRPIFRSPQSKSQRASTLHPKLEQRYKDMYFFEKIVAQRKRNTPHTAIYLVLFVSNVHFSPKP